MLFEASFSAMLWYCASAMGAKARSASDFADVENGDGSSSEVGGDSARAGELSDLECVDLEAVDMIWAAAMHKTFSRTSVIEPHYPRHGQGCYQ